MMLLFFANVEAIFYDCQLAGFLFCILLAFTLVLVSYLISEEFHLSFSIWSEKVTCALAPSTQAQAGSLSYTPHLAVSSVCLY